MAYTVYLAPAQPTGTPELIGRFATYREAERAARRAVAGSRGSVAGCIPACDFSDDAIDGFADRDGAEDAQCSWIERARRRS